MCYTVCKRVHAYSVVQNAIYKMRRLPQGGVPSVLLATSRFRASPEAAPRGQYLLRLAHCRTVAPINRSEKPYINNIAPRADLCIAIFELSIKKGVPEMPPA